MISFRYCHFIFVLCFISINVNAQEDTTLDVEFAEPIFVDTATDIGGEKGVLEVNAIPTIKKQGDEFVYELGFELEYVLFNNFGVELEPIFSHSDLSNAKSSTTFNSLELETQYTLFTNTNSGFAGGIGIAVPIEDNDFELEPFLLYIYKVNYNLSLHPRAGFGIGFGQQEVEFNYNFAVLYTFETAIMAGLEINGSYQENENNLFIAPQIGIELNELFLGTGVQISTNSNQYNITLRAVYEFLL
ncbi:hypothetical protein [uncultured Psychroserpens sp.]|uniref:hypothetical protein n=1 Tax=uncultured Psychroserpens sp. TaxID=255436 RepID=UPI0026063F4E|nr:hypothetical protein [uncultured Psychroserpens sp.]